MLNFLIMLRKDPDDNELIDRILKGEVNIYRFLLNKYEPVVLRILKKRLPFNKLKRWHKSFLSKLTNLCLLIEDKVVLKIGCHL